MRLSLLSLVVLGLLTADVHAQLRNSGGNRRQGTTVQLPTFNVFSISTSVLVPDRGAVMLGGIGGSSSSRTSRGFPLMPGGSSALGNTSGASGVSVHAWIHDLEGMDKALLAEAARRRGELVLAPLEAPPSDGKVLPSVREIEQRVASQESAQQQEARRHFDKAQQLAAGGKQGVARIYYQMALRRADGPLKREITAAMSRLSSSSRIAAGQ